MCKASKYRQYVIGFHDVKTKGWRIKKNLAKKMITRELITWTPSDREEAGSITLNRITDEACECLKWKSHEFQWFRQLNYMFSTFIVELRIYKYHFVILFLFPFFMGLLLPTTYMRNSIWLGEDFFFSIIFYNFTNDIENSKNSYIRSLCKKKPKMNINVK